MHHILGIGAISVVAFLPCPKIVSPNMECGMSSVADPNGVACLCNGALHI